MKQIFLLRSAIALLTLALGVAISLAQTSDLAAIRGNVTDSNGAVVPGSSVKLVNESTGIVKETATDDEGRFSFSNLPLTGAYTISVSKTGFQLSSRTGIQLRAGESAIVDISLFVGNFDGVNVTIRGTTEGVQSDSAQLGTRLDLERIENTPVLNRRMTNLVELNSAARPARGTGDLFVNNYLFVINGSGRRQTTFILDGSTGNDSWGRQTVFTNIPLGALQEFTVITNPISAEYGRTSGSVINIVTKSGTNQFHFDGITLIRPSALQASQPLAPRRTRDELVQLSGIVSGPIVKDRTHFVFGAEGNWQRRDTVITSILAPGTYPGKYGQALAFARIDHQINDNNTLTGRFSLDRFVDYNANDSVGGNSLPSGARTFERDTSTYQLALSSAITPKMVNEARFAFLWASPITKFTPVTPSTQLLRTLSNGTTSTEGESRSALLTNRQSQFADSLTTILGSHSLKLGGDILHSTSGGDGQEFGSGFVLGQFRLTSANAQNPLVPTSALTIDDASQFTQSFGTSTYSVHEWLWSAFIQDDWHIRHDLTVNLGLRYERQTFTDDTNNFAPRVGFAYNPRGDTKTVIRGSFGIYYSEIRANTAASFALNGPEGVFTFTVNRTIGQPPPPFFPPSLGPLPGFPAGAVLPARDITIRPGRADYYSRFFDVSRLTRYPNKLLNPETYQSTAGVQRALPLNMFLSVDYVHARTIKIDRTIDLNAPTISFKPTTAGQTRTTAAANVSRPITPANNGYRRILGVVNEGVSNYDGLQFNLEKRMGKRLTFLASYTLSNTKNTIEFDAPGGDPNDVNFLGLDELGTSLLDQRHRFVFSGSYKLPLGFTFGGVTTAASPRPFAVTAGVDTNGDGANSDRPFDLTTGTFLQRNSRRGSATFSTDLFVQKQFALSERLKLQLRAEGFNIFNHPNIYGRNGSYGRSTVQTAGGSTTPPPSFGTALGGISNVDPGREIQFELRLSY